MLLIFTTFYKVSPHFTKSHHISQSRTTFYYVFTLPVRSFTKYPGPKERVVGVFGLGEELFWDLRCCLSGATVVHWAHMSAPPPPPRAVTPSPDSSVPPKADQTTPSTAHVVSRAPTPEAAPLVPLRTPKRLGAALIGYRTARPTNTSVRTVCFENFVVRWTVLFDGERRFSLPLVNCMCPLLCWRRLKQHNARHHSGRAVERRAGGSLGN